MDIENRLAVAKGEDWKRNEWGYGVSTCKLLYVQWINNKVLLYSTENYIQYPVINRNGKNIKMNVCMFVYIHICMYN